MEPIGKVIDGIVARVISAQKGPAGFSRRSVLRGETSKSADPRAASESPDEPAMGERGDISFGSSASSADDRDDVLSATG